MKKTILILILSIVAQCFYAQNLDSILTRVNENDQQTRLKTIELFRKGNLNGFTQQMMDSLLLLEEKTKRKDATNILIIDRILQNGWPDSLTKSSYNTIFLVIEHASVDKQQLYLPYIKEAAQKGDINLADFATLSDRIDLKKGRPQTYGTQSITALDEEGNNVLYIWTIKQPDQINQLRKSVGLGSIEKYVHTLETNSGCRCIYNPDITVDELKKLSPDF